MYQIGERVICGNKGVCSVEQITTLNIPGVDKGRRYYILKPLYMTSSTVYIPVDNADNVMRRALEREEVEKLIEKLPALEPIPIANEKFLEQEYKNYLRTDRCEEWIRIVKTVLERQKKRLIQGRKLTSVDSRYYKTALDYLCGEFASALEMDKECAEEYIMGLLEETVTEGSNS